MRQQVEHWRAQQLSAQAAKLTIYRAFIEGDLGVPNTSPGEYTNSISIPASGVRASNDVEPVQRVHLAIQGTRPDSAVYSHCQAGWFLAEQFSEAF